MAESSSLVHFMENRKNRPKKIFFGRAGTDGIPFRGEQNPMLREAEFDARTVEVRDFRHKFFDIAIEEQAAEYQEVMSKIANGWFILRHQVFFVNNTTKHYVEWLERYREDGSLISAMPGNTEGISYASGPG